MVLNIIKNFIFLSLIIINLIDNIVPIRRLSLDEAYTLYAIGYRIYALLHFILKGLYFGGLTIVIGSITSRIKLFEIKYIEDNKIKSIFKYLLAIIWYSINIIGYYLYYITETRYSGFIKSIYIILLAIIYLLVPTLVYNGSLTI